MINKNVFRLVLFSWLITGQVALAQSSAPNSVDALACLTDKVDYNLNTEVIDFEMQGGGGLNAGFSPTGVALTNLTIGANYSQGQLQTMMHVTDPLKPNVPIADVGGSATQHNMTFSVDFAMSLLKFGPSYYYSTTVSALSESALTHNLHALQKSLTALKNNEWWTTITDLDGTKGFLVPVGSLAGLVVGDQLKVMDARYLWAGAARPCQDELIMPIMNSNRPKAFARATQVGVDYAYFEIMNQEKSLSIHDYVTISALIQQKQLLANLPLRTLSRSIRLGSITSKPLVFTGQGGLSTTVDISPFVKDQLDTLIPGPQFEGYYVHQ